MSLQLSQEEMLIKEKTEKFVNQYIKPRAAIFDSDHLIAEDLFDHLRENNYFGINVSKKYGGQELSFKEITIIHEEFGKGCSSVRALLTVHGMVTMAVEQWGSNELKNTLLPQLASGEKIGAFCLTEPEAGSDTQSITTEAREEEDSYVINGVKKWITMGQRADVLLVITKVNNLPSVFVVDKEISKDILIKPINNMVGLKASNLAEITFSNCTVPKSNLLGRVGIGLSHIAISSLQYGRLTIASGCVGTAQECLSKSLEYVKRRKQFGNKIYNHQLIKKMLTEMITEINVSRLLCYETACLMQNNDKESAIHVFMAKYYCSKMAKLAVDYAIQIHGAEGLTIETGLERFYRDIKANEIIEGTSQIHEIIIANNELSKKVRR